jgi:hypothetical protein
MTCEIIEDYLLTRLQEDRSSLDTFVSAIAETFEDEKGKNAEELLSYYISLVVRRSRNAITLFDILKKFYPYEETISLGSYWKELKSYYCDSWEVTNLRQLTELTDFTSLSNNPDMALFYYNGEYSSNRILYNFNNFMGVDVGFLVRNIEDDSLKFVAVQSKNTATGALSAALKTLSPGLQFFTNQERSSLCDKFCDGGPKGLGFSTSKQRENKNTGFLSKIWILFNSFAVKHPTLVNNWIRVAAIAQIPKPEDYELIYNSFRSSLSADRQDLWENSPFVLITTNSSKWLTEDIRNNHITYTANEPISKSTNNNYLPIPLDFWKQYCTPEELVQFEST